MATSSVALPVLPADRPLRLTPTDVSQFVRLEQCERFLRFRLAERAGQKFMEDYDVTPQRITPLLSLSGHEFEEGIEKGRALLRMPNGPTAIFAGNDLQALGVYQAAREARLHIPEDLSVVGFDDLPVAQWVGPPLTTVRQPLIDMATVAAEMVVAMASGDPLPQPRVELATELVIRESTAPPA